MKKVFLFLISLALLVSGCTVETIEQAVPTEVFKVTYETEFGKAPDSFFCQKGFKLTAEKLPVLDDTETYIFSGWYAENAKTMTGFKITANTVLKARWINRIQCCITYESERGSVPSAVTLPKETKLSGIELPELSCDDYAFTGWYIGEQKIDAGYELLSDITLTAKWQSTGLLRIEVSGELKNKIYLVGEKFDPTGLTVTAFYADGSAKDVSDLITSDLDTSSIIYNGREITVTLTLTQFGKTATTTITDTFYVAASDALTKLPYWIENNQYGYRMIKFGDWPQDICPEEPVHSDSPLLNEWYLGSDGYFYENSVENGRVSDAVCYSDGTHVKKLEENSRRWFKVQPLKWEVIDENCSGNLLMWTYPVRGDIETYGSVIGSWTETNVRAYLNSQPIDYESVGLEGDIDWTGRGFITEAFSDSAQMLIINREINEDLTSCTDRIFLLSEEEFLLTHLCNLKGEFFSFRPSDYSLCKHVLFTDVYNEFRDPIARQESFDLVLIRTLSKSIFNGVKYLQAKENNAKLKNSDGGFPFGYAHAPSDSVILCPLCPAMCIDPANVR